MKWRPNDVLKCALCEKCSDSHEHLFFESEFSAKIWEDMQDLMNKKTTKKWKDIVEEFSRIPACKNIRNIVCKLVCGAAVYYVWQERNARIFRKTKRDEADVIQNITDTVKMRILSLRVKDSVAVRAVEEKWKIRINRANSLSV